MKTNLPLGCAALLAAGIAFSASIVSAQDSSVAAGSTEPVAQSVATPAPHFAYGVSQILQLSQAKVPDETIVTYIKGSGNGYGLNADQIIYLQQQGVSSTVINAMLSQPRPGVAAYAAAPAPAVPVPVEPAPAYDSQPASQPVVVTPPVTAIDPGYTAYYYSQPAYYSYYYPSPYYYPAYGYYGCYPAATFSVGWGRGWGGYGWHGGGAWHGGDFHRGFSGGFHGGSIGFHGGAGGFHGGFHR